MFNIYKKLFHSTKTFETLKTAASGTKFLGAKLNGKKTSGKIFSKNLGIPREVVLFFGNFGKCCSGSCRKFIPDVLVGWKAPIGKPLSSRFGQMESKIQDWLISFRNRTNCRNQFHLPKNGCEGLKMNFRFEFLATSSSKWNSIFKNFQKGDNFLRCTQTFEKFFPEVFFPCNFSTVISRIFG